MAEIYCQGCGDEIGPEHRRTCDFDERIEEFCLHGTGTPPSHRFCFCCGVPSPATCAECCTDLGWPAPRSEKQPEFGDGGETPDERPIGTGKEE